MASATRPTRLGENRRLTLPQASRDERAAPGRTRHVAIDAADSEAAEPSWRPATEHRGFIGGIVHGPIGAVDLAIGFADACRSDSGTAV